MKCNRESFISYISLSRRFLQTVAAAGLVALYACGGGSPTAPSPPGNPGPARSNPRPTGTLPTGTKSIEMGLDTLDEDAMCKFGETAGVPYDNLPTYFLQTGGRKHSIMLNDLNNRQTYLFYAKCADRAGNKNLDDFLVQFSIEDRTKITINVVPASYLTPLDGNLEFHLNDSSLGRITGSSATFENVPTGTFSYKITGPNVDGGKREGTIEIPAGESSTYPAIKVQMKYEGKSLVERIDNMNRSNNAQAGMRGDRPATPNGTVRPIEPLDIYYDATIKENQSDSGRREHLKTIEAIYNKLRTVDSFFAGYKLFYVCNPNNKPADVPRCDTPNMPEDFVRGNLVERVHLVKYTAPGGTSNFIYVKNNYRGHNNVTVSALTVLSPEVSGSGFWQDFVEPAIGFDKDYDGPNQDRLDSNFNDGFNYAASLTRLDEAIIQSHLAKLPETVTAFNDSKIVVLKPVSTVTLNYVKPTYTGGSVIPDFFNKQDITQPGVVPGVQDNGKTIDDVVDEEPDGFRAPPKIIRERKDWLFKQMPF